MLNEIGDEVDQNYYNNIREALSSRNIERLMELIPGMTSERAMECISEWQSNYLATMNKIREGQDTSDLTNESYNLLRSLVDEAHLSGHYSRK